MDNTGAALFSRKTITISFLFPFFFSFTNNWTIVKIGQTSVPVESLAPSFTDKCTKSGGARRSTKKWNRTQGCINCAILPFGMGARGVSSEHVENMEMFSLFSNLGALGFSENLIRYSLHIWEVKSNLFSSDTLIYGISRDGSKNFSVHTCEHMILGQLTMGARQKKNAPLIELKLI